MTGLARPTGELESSVVTHSPENPDFDPIELTPHFVQDISAIAACVSVLKSKPRNASVFRPGT
jgi:hypothetical protein